MTLPMAFVTPMVANRVKNPVPLVMLLAAAGPLVGGWLYGATGGRAPPLRVYALTLVPMALGGLMMARPGRYLEDEGGA